MLWVLSQNYIKLPTRMTIDSICMHADSNPLVNLNRLLTYFHLIETNIVNRHYTIKIPRAVMQ